MSIKPKYKIGDYFIIHDRWHEAYDKSIQEGRGIPHWSFPFPFGTGDYAFLPRHAKCLTKILGITESSYSEEEPVYRLEFFTEEYWKLDDSDKNDIWVEEKDMLIFLDKIDINNIEELLNVNV